MTIWQAAKKVLRDKKNEPMSVDEIYNSIVEQKLFEFGAKDPKSVVSSAIRQRSTQNKKAKDAVFERVSPGTYKLVD